MAETKDVTPLDRLKAAMGEGWECSIVQPPDYTDRWYAKATRLHGRAMDSGIVIESECFPTESAAADALLAARDAAFPSTRHEDMVRGATLALEQYEKGNTPKVYSSSAGPRGGVGGQTITGEPDRAWAARIVSEWEREQEAGR